MTAFVSNGNQSPFTESRNATSSNTLDLEAALAKFDPYKKELVELLGEDYETSDRFKMALEGVARGRWVVSVMQEFHGR